MEVGLRLLQDDYHVNLYYKKNSGVELTDDGRDFLIHTQKIVREIEALKMRFSHTTSRSAARPFAVGGTYALASELLPRLLSEFKTTHPPVNVALRTGSSFTIHDKILRGDIEVGLVAKTPRSKNIEVQLYGTHTLVAFVHTNHPYARKGDPCRTRERTVGSQGRAPITEQRRNRSAAARL